jgi:leader peptidase (prepilin peptidase)/N-methyltransferase
MSVFTIIVLFGLVGLTCLISYVDFRWYAIPDVLNVSVFSLGLTYNFSSGWQDALQACLFAAIVGIAVYTMRHVHMRLTGRIGLGMGDVKLSAAAAVWLSPWNFPIFLFLASGSALIFFIVTHGVQGKALRSQRIPFGPFLALALVLTWNGERLNWVALL